MRQVVLQEFKTSEPIQLSLSERDQLAKLAPSLSIRPVVGSRDKYELQPDSVVGSVYLDELTIVIRPKLPISRVMFLISYALNSTAWSKTVFDYSVVDTLVEALLPSFVHHLRNAFRRGLLQGYRYEEDTLCTVRGRIRVADQVRRRFGIAPPIEVAFDDLTEDIPENRFLKASLERLRHMRLKSDRLRRELRHFDTTLQAVSDITFRARELPDFQYTRLNQHYRPALELAKLILSNSSFELNTGTTAATAFLVDMNEVFESFVAIALQDALRLSRYQWVRNGNNCGLHLDNAGIVRLAPDISWWSGPKCVFVGDIKYKRVNVKGVKHHDLYQLLAYTIATDLPRGLLIYAAGEDVVRTHMVTHAGKQLEVINIHLADEPEQILGEIGSVADRIRQQQVANADFSLLGE